MIRTNHNTERGQTLPIWVMAILTSLSLIYLSLNYANVLHWQTRAQTAADAAASAALAFQSLDLNKMTVLLYSADVEEWRIRHLIQGMLDTGVYHPTAGGLNTQNTIGNGGCTYPAAALLSQTPSNATPGGSCFWIYENLYSQYLKAVARYTSDIKMLHYVASNMNTSTQSFDAQWNVHLSGGACSYPVDCAFTYNMLDYSTRPTTQGVGRDAAYAQMGGFTASTTPASVWQPARIEVAACMAVPPLINFKIFGLSPQSVTVIGRAAATNVPINEEWLEPGVDSSTTLGGVFQPTEVYNNAGDASYAVQDTYGSSQSPRPWYETNYPGLTYTAQSGTPSMPYKLNAFGDDFEAMVTWWNAIPIAPYVTTSYTTSQICSQEAPNS